MRAFSPSESCKEIEFKALKAQSWLQVERGRLSEFSNDTSSSINDVLKLIEYALEGSSLILASLCLQVFLQELSKTLSDKKVRSSI